MFSHVALKIAGLPLWEDFDFLIVQPSGSSSSVEVHGMESKGGMEPKSIMDFIFPSFDEALDAIGLPPEAISSTMAAWNEAVEAGDALYLDPYSEPDVTLRVD